MDIQGEMIACTIRVGKLSLRAFCGMFKGMARIYKKGKQNRTKIPMRKFLRETNSVGSANLEDIGRDYKFSKDDLHIFHKVLKKAGLQYSLAFNKKNDEITFFFDANKGEAFKRAFLEMERQLKIKKHREKVKEVRETKRTISKERGSQTLEQRIALTKSLFSNYENSNTKNIKKSNNLKQNR